MSTRVGSHTRACGGAVVTRATRDVRVSYGVVYTRRRGRRRRRVSVASFIHGRCRSDGRPWRGGVRRAACEAVDHDDSDAGGGGSPGETWAGGCGCGFCRACEKQGCLQSNRNRKRAEQWPVHFLFFIALL